jgi:hypothetical protein
MHCTIHCIHCTIHCTILIHYTLYYALLDPALSIVPLEHLELQVNGIGAEGCRELGARLERNRYRLLTINRMYYLLIDYTHLLGRNRYSLLIALQSVVSTVY